MTLEEAQGVMKIAAAAAVARDADIDRAELHLRHLLPLPFERTRDHVHAYATTHKWLSTLPELLDACGVAEAARPDLVRAVREGGQLVPDLRSRTGWSYVARGEALPPGALEAAAVAARAPIPLVEREPEAWRALPPPTDERVVALVAEMAARRRVAERRALTPVRTAAEIERDAEAFEVKRQRVLAQIRAHDAHAAALATP